MATDAATGKTYTADVVQFLRPNGRQKPITTQLPADTHDAYRAMLAAGCRFETEVLRTQEVSVTITRDEKDFDISVTPNGPEVQGGMVAMLQARLWEEEPDTDDDTAATEG